MKKALFDALEQTPEARCFCGFDGFVDEVVHTVDRRIDAETYTRVMTLSEYGKRIADASGLSINVEIVTVDKKLGGNGPIFANGLKKLGASVVYIGSVGRESVDPVFHELADGGEVIGVADPGRTDAMEFADGKIIRSKLASLSDVTWRAVLDKTGLDGFVRRMDAADLISFNNWTMLPHMSGLWDGILSEAVPRMQSDKAKKLLFFDLADPEKRTEADIAGALARIRAFSEAGFRVALGLNRKEACEISAVLGAPVNDVRTEPLEALTKRIASAMGLYCVTVHPVERAACCLQGEYAEEAGPYCAAPKLTTGAGDNYNAGFVFGLLMGLPARQCLLMGMAASGYYVRFCHSPSVQEARGFLADWGSGRLDKE